MSVSGRSTSYDFRARVTRRPLACGCAAFSGAVLLAVYVLTGWQMLLLGGLLLFFGLSLCLREHRFLGMLLICAAAGTGVFFLRFWQTQALEQHWAGRVEPLTLQVLDFGENAGEGSRAEAEITSQGPLHGVRISLYLPQPDSAVTPGDEIQGIFTLHSAREAPPWTLYHYSNGVLLKGSARQWQLRHRETPVRLLPRVAAHRLGDSLTRLFTPEQAGFLFALTTGNRDRMWEELDTALTHTGLRHIVAASGLHVTILVNTIFLLPGNRRRKSLLLLPLLLLFAGIAGFSPSICRAALMETVLLLAPILEREEDSLTSLAFALALILLHNPYAAASVGLQLSFAACLGLLAVTPPLLKHRQKQESMRERAKRFVGNSLAATLGANVFTLPLVLAHFGWASLWSPLSNLVVLWVLPLLLPLGLLCALLGILSLPLALPFAAVTARLTGAVIWLIKALARLPQARLTDSVVTLWWLALAYLTGVLLLSGRLKGGRKWAAVSLLAVSCLLCLLPLRDTRLPAGAVRLDLLDVGQGQCVLLTTREKTIVIDCGSQQYKADTALPERLEQLHRDHVDCLILTHYDSDHINGVPSLLERCPVERMLLPVPEQEDEPIQAELLQRARSHGTHITEIHQDTTLLIQPLTLSVTHIGAGSNGGLAILATSGAFDLLVTGDADMDGEEELLRQWQLPAVEVLVAGHHGSRYSTGEALLRQARPEAVLISVGENDYGHPAQEVLERCEAAGAQIWRTDESGTLTVQYDPGT